MTLACWQAGCLLACKDFKYIDGARNFLPIQKGLKKVKAKCYGCECCDVISEKSQS
jgi:hypothetical protein